MDITSCYPVVMVDDADVAATAGFFTAHFGFETVFAVDWYVSLRHGSFELAVLASSHETIPEGFRGARGGVLVNIEVADVDAVHERLRDALDIVLPLRNETFGQRHFIALAPGGVLVDVIQVIEPADDYAAAFATT
jgi:catechol 2,3-dioxygenase-like lactoylglutathione lyase family enzyme